MNPYFSSRLADDRLAERLSEHQSDHPSDHPSLGGTGVVPVGTAVGPARRLRRRAGWLLVGAGLRLAMERDAVSLRG